MIQLPPDFKMIFRCIIGSNLYGTNTPLSDVDERGVFIPSEKFFHGFLDKTEQFEDKVNDITYFELRKFLYLALDSNPNIIELLFIPEKNTLLMTNEWEDIIANREHFLSKKARFSFSGYAYTQLNRIKRHRNWLLNPPKKKPERTDYGLSDNKPAMPKEQIGAFNRLLTLYLEDIKDFHPLKTQLEELTETRDFHIIVQELKSFEKETIKKIIPISDNFLEALEKEKAYLNAKREWDHYQNWKLNRNADRAALEEKFGFDCKHGAHCFRLISQCEELLMTGFITFPRPDAELLLEIRYGKWSYDELLENVNSFEGKFEDLYKSSILPHKPNRDKVNELCIKIVRLNIF